MSHKKETLLIIVIILLGVPHGLDFLHELAEQEHDITYLLKEAAATLLTIMGLVYLIWEIRWQQREAAELRTQLGRTRADLVNARSDLSALNNKVQHASREYGKVIQEQMTAWGFTPSEREVALLLLKGLSFEEIANVRGKSEKTVRQQATAAYRKSGLNGRHELAAWFFEDFLQ